MRFEGVTRRGVVKAGGGLAVAVLGGGFGSRRSVATPVAAPVASPAAGDGLAGRYVVVRSRTLAGTRPAADVLGTIREGFVPLLRSIPGFVAYLGIADPAARQTAFVGVFDDEAGADESTRRGGTWLTDNCYDFFAGDPIVVEGPIGVAAGGGAGGAATAASIAGDGVEGDYVVIRSRTLKAGRSGAELLGMIEEGFVPLVAAAPGFVAYLAGANEGTRDQFSIGIYADAAGAEASTRRAAEWGTRGAADFVEGDPTVVQGTIAIAVVGREP